MNRRQFLALTAVAGVGATGAYVYRLTNQPSRFSVDLKDGFSDSGFTKKSTAMSVTEGLDLKGKNILVTGCNSGMGYATMKALAKRGAHVIGTGRTPEKAEKACAKVGGETTPLVMELMEPESVLKCAEDLLTLNIPIDGLILNAGISGRPELKFVRGIEKTFYVNFLGHFLFANKAMPAVEAAEQGRVVHIGSSASFTRPSVRGIRFEALAESYNDPHYDGWEAYGQSKLANAMFSLKLAKMYEGTNVTSNALHPGLVNTKIARGMDFGTRAAFATLGPVVAKSPGEGAATHAYCATHPNMAGVNGQFLIDSNVVTVSGAHHLENFDLAERVWAYAESVFSEYLI